MYDDRQQKRDAARQQAWEVQAQNERNAAVAALLEHRHGRRYLYWLLEISGAIGVNPFQGNALHTAFACGEQNVGQKVLAHLLEVAPDGFLVMLKENADERAERSRSSQPRPAGGDTFSNDPGPGGSGEEG